jgi:hypothetical protein
MMDYKDLVMEYMKDQHIFEIEVVAARYLKDFATWLDLHAAQLLRGADSDIPKACPNEYLHGSAEWSEFAYCPTCGERLSS